MTVFNPVREIWEWFSIKPAHGSAVGDWVNTSNIIGPIAIKAVLGAAITATRTITFEAATEDPSAAGTALGSSAAAINKGGFCDPVSALSIVVDPTDAAVIANGGAVIVDFLQCPAMFIRAKLDAADTHVCVTIAGKAARLNQV